jgi:hypothetical protein
VVLVLRGGDASIDGVVVDGEGKPVAGAALAAYPETLRDDGSWLPPSATARSDARGAFRLERLGAASEVFRLVASASSFRPGGARDVPGSASGLRVVLRPHPRVTGRIVRRGPAAATRPHGIQHDFPSIHLRSPEEARRLKGFRGQTAHWGASFEAGTGRFWLDASGPGVFDLVVEPWSGSPTLVRRIEVAEGTNDVGTIEID